MTVCPAGQPEVEPGTVSVLVRRTFPAVAAKAIVPMASGVGKAIPLPPPEAC
jgi:hypothetical protein